MSNLFIADDSPVAGLTPYHSYKTTKRFEGILNDIERGIIPTNTGVPFPVTFEEDFKKKDDRNKSIFDVRQTIDSLY